MKSLLKMLVVTSVMITGLVAPLSIDVSDLVSRTPSEALVVQKSEPIISLSVAHAAGTLKSNLCNWETAGMGCFVDALLWIYELLIYDLTQVVAAIMGLFLDWVLLHSISSQSYKGGMIEAGWEILRDFTNIIFVFALLVLAFQLVLGRQSRGGKITLVKTILVAIVINFSLFATYAVIDASNILAHTMYNKIETTGDIALNDPGGNVSGEAEDGLNALTKFFTQFNEQEFKSPSIAILASINPQRIVTGRDPSTGVLEGFVAVTAAGIFNILLIGIFFSIGMIFIGRTVGLMLLGVMAPLAFATITLGQKGVKWIGFDNWGKDLLKLSFTAPVFLFLMYLTITFATNQGFLASIQTTDASTTLSRIFAVLLPFAIIAVLLITSKKITESMSEGLGSTIVDYTKKAIGGTVALAAGGAALAGRQVLGRAASAALKSENTKKLVAKTGRYGRALYSGLEKTKSSSFDFRSSKIGSSLIKNSGLTAPTQIQKFGQAEGGFKKWKENRESKRESDTKALNSWLSTKDDSLKSDGKIGITAPVVDPTTGKMVSASGVLIAGKNATGEYIDDAGNVVLPPKTQTRKKKDVENEKLEQEAKRKDKQDQRTDARQRLTDAEKREKNATTATERAAAQADKAAAQAEVTKLNSEIKELGTTIKDLGDSMKDKQRTKEYLETEKSIDSNNLARGAVGVGLGLGLGAVIPGAALGGGLAMGIRSIIKKYKEREFNRDLKGAKYRQDKKEN
jgi:hypothetical protein